MNKKLISKILSYVLAMGLTLYIGHNLGYNSGFQASGGTFKALSSDELEKGTEFSQYLSAERDIKEALASGLYSHCVSYPGSGLVFMSQNDSKENVISLIIGGSEVDKLKKSGQEIGKGDIVITPLAVLRGDINSPLKIEYRSQGDMKKKSKSLLLSRKMLTKCYLKTPRENQADNDNIQAF